MQLGEGTILFLLIAMLPPQPLLREERTSASSVPGEHLAMWVPVDAVYTALVFTRPRRPPSAPSTAHCMEEGDC